MKESMLKRFRDTAKEKDLGVLGIHVYQRGKAIQLLFRDEERNHLYSGSKAFTSMAVGIAAREGRFALSDNALDFFPEYRSRAEERNEKITIKDLLQMRAGHETSLFDVSETSWERELDWAETFFKTPMHTPAGTAFVYDNGSSYMLSRIVEAASGQTLRDYLMPRLFGPMNIFNPQWHTCPGGHSLGAIGLYLTTEEFSRLGILLLQNGQWQGRQLVPERYVLAAANDTVNTEGFGDIENRQGYGYKLWRCTVPGAFRADGKYGQYSIVLPDREAVVTVTAHNERCANDILRAVWSEVLPELE